MDLFIFHHDEYERLYNCSFKTYDEWLKYGTQNFVQGQLYLFLGAAYLVLYIPILRVMMHPKLFQNSCWKIMFFLGNIDIASTILNCIIPGYLGIRGVVGCNYINFLYVAGCSAIFCWFCQCCACVVLAINRCVDFWKPRWMVWLFEGKRISLWIGACLAYALSGFMFCASPIFNSGGMAYFFDPYMFISEKDVPMDRSTYMSTFHSATNLTIVFTLPLLYGFLILSVWWKSRGAESASLSKMQRQLFFQAFSICFLNFSAAFLYVYMQFFPIPFFFITLGQMTWQGSNGAVFIYLALNRTIRSGVLRMVCGPFARYQTGPLVTVASVSVKPTAPNTEAAQK
uniref:G protein-coupled receptor n=1 Tax=Steinernema glaseri TaxID=37863 RepID=A0A1I7ZKJ8_9BILA